MQKAAKRLRFTSAVFHHLNAMKLQRALRAYWALKLARTQIQSVIMIQVWVRGMNWPEKVSKQRQAVISVPLSL